MPENLPGHYIVLSIFCGWESHVGWNLVWPILTLLHLPWLTLVILLCLPSLGFLSIFVNEKLTLILHTRHYSGPLQIMIKITWCG